MKLSKKGIDKALNIGADLMDYGRSRREFEQSDFEGVVVFTIEEALGIRKAMNPGPEDVKWRDLLERRIGLAELEFDQKDSKGAVVLTVKEAKYLAEAIDCLEEDVEGIDETSRSLIKSRCVRYHLGERIKQAEKEKK